MLNFSDWSFTLTMKSKLNDATLRTDAWALPLLVCGILLISALLLYEVYTLCKGNPVKRISSRLMDQAVMLGLLLLASTAVVAPVPPTAGSCSALHMLPGVGYSLLTSGLLLRACSLLYHHQPLPNLVQGLLLLFINLSQVIISFQGLGSTNAKGDKPVSLSIDAENCPNSNALLLSLLYPAFLVLLLFIIALKARRKHAGINKRDASYVAIATFFAAALGACWVGCLSLIGPTATAASLGYGTCVTSLIVFVVCFVPHRNLKSSIFDDTYVCNENPLQIQSADESSSIVHENIGNKSFTKHKASELFLVPVPVDDYTLTPPRRSNRGSRRSLQNPDVYFYSKNCPDGWLY